MKRFIIFLLVLTMLTGMGSIAYAAVLEDQNGSGTATLTDDISGSATADVYGKYSDADMPEPVYSVKVSWEAIEFKCKVTGQQVWKPASHEWQNGLRYSEWITPDGASSATERDVVITNSSNVPIKVTAEWKAETDSYGLKPYFDALADENIFTLDTPADGTGVNDTHILKVGINPGQPKVDMPTGEPIKIGTLTITFEAVDTQ